MSMSVEWNGRKAWPVGHRFIDVPIVIGGISGDPGGKLVEGHHGTPEEGTKIGDVGFVEGQGVLGEQDVSIHRISACRHP